MEPLNGLVQEGFQLFTAPVENLGGTTSFPEAFIAGPGVRGDVFKIEDNTAAYNAVTYGVEKVVDEGGVVVGQRAYIRIEEGTLTLVDCNTIRVLTDVEIYLSDQDVDPKDGFPDDGEIPVVTLVDAESTILRLSMRPNDDDDD